MSIKLYQPPIQLAGSVGIFPNFRFMVSGDSFSDITSAGYLNESGEQLGLSMSDVIQVIYDYDLQQGKGQFGSFTVSISEGIITLYPAASSGDVILPVVDGNFANFSGTSGAIKDDGYYPSNSAHKIVAMVSTDSDEPKDAFVPCFLGTDGTIGQPLAGTQYSFNGSVIAGNNASGVSGYLVASSGLTNGSAMALKSDGNSYGSVTTISDSSTLGQSTTYYIPDPVVSEANFAVFDKNPVVIDPGNLLVAGASPGVIADGGAPGTTFVSTEGETQMKLGSFLKFDTDVQTINPATDIVTINTQSGEIQTNTLTTAGGSSYSFTMANSLLKVGSTLLLQIQYGSNLTKNIECYVSVPASVGTVEIAIQNNNTVPMNGNMSIYYLILN